MYDHLAGPAAANRCVSARIIATTSRRWAIPPYPKAGSPTSLSSYHDDRDRTGTPIFIRTGPAFRVDWEAELAIVIGRGCRDIRPAEALEPVAAMPASTTSPHAAS